MDFFPESATVCEHESLVLTCPGDSIIIVSEAQYGHLGLSKCVDFNTGHFGCSANVTLLLNQKCAGKRKCEVSEQDKRIREMNPCRKGLDVFLLITYQCLNGMLILNYCHLKPKGLILILSNIADSSCITPYASTCSGVSNDNTLHNDSQPNNISALRDLYVCSLSAKLAVPCQENHIRADRLVISNLQMEESPCSSQSGSSEFNLKARKGQNLLISMEAIGGLSSDKYQIGFILDESNDEVTPIWLDASNRNATHSSDVTISVFKDSNVHFLIFVEGEN